MTDTCPQFVTDDENEVALRLDSIRSVSVVTWDDETLGQVRFTDGSCYEIKEREARQIIRQLSE